MYRTKEEALQQLLEDERSRQELEQLIEIIRKSNAEQFILKLAGAILQAPGQIKLSS